MATAATVDEHVLPVGARLIPLTMHRDDRGIFTEVFREEWETGIAPVQWNVVRSEQGVLRGVHVHPRHDDYLIVLAGRATIGLRDLRQGSPTEGLTVTVEMRGDRLEALVTPHGVAHGFFFHEPSTHLYAVTHSFDPSDELGCHWADPELAIPWGIRRAHVSVRDAGAQTFRELRAELEAFQPIA